MTCRQEDIIDEDLQNFLNKLQTKLVGNFLCYRRYEDDFIRVRKLFDGDCAFSNERHINLAPVLIDKEEDLKYIQFKKIPRSSYQMIKGECAGQLTFYSDLVGVTIKNMTFIFDLNEETQNPKEVNFIEGNDQLTTLDGFVNLGTNHMMINSFMVEVGKKKQQKTVQMHTNEQASLYFRESRSKATIKVDPDNLFSKNCTSKKKYTKHFAGNIFRTYTYLDLLDLLYARNKMLKEESFSFNDETILATYQGHTVFSIFLYRLEAFENILENIS